MNSSNGCKMRLQLARPLDTPTSLPLQLGVRYRLLDSETWHDGQVEGRSEECLVFLSDLPLEIGTLLEVAMPVAALGRIGIQPDSTYVRVVERVLDRWPELTTAITAQFLAAPAHQMPGAA